jgi:hypothetical protein
VALLDEFGDFLIFVGCFLVGVFGLLLWICLLRLMLLSLGGLMR